jgi:spectinomycin phosphotransferase
MIAEALESGYGHRVRQVEELSGGYDAAARTFRVETAHGERLFVKHRLTLDPGIALSAALHEGGIEEVLAPTRTLHGELAQRIENGVLLVYPFREGHNGFERPLRPHHWQQLGDALRRIHNTALIPDTLARETFRVPRVNTLEAAIAQELFRTGEETVRRLIGETTRLGERCRAGRWKFVPSHADLHVGNVLVEENGRLWIVDWDAPRLSPRECDLTFFRDGGILDLHGVEEEERFFAGYGPFETDPDALAYFQYARILEDLVEFAEEATTSSMPDKRARALEGYEAQFRSRRLLALAKA